MPSPQADSDSAHVLTPAERDCLRPVAVESGVAAVAAHMHVSRDALARAIAGLPVRRGTLVLIRAGLAATATAEAGQ
jgi:hypothetical protein